MKRQAKKHSPSKSTKLFSLIFLFVAFVGTITIVLWMHYAPLQAQAQSTTLARPGILPGQYIWSSGVSSFLFGTNNTQSWDLSDNIETDPHHIIQPSLKDAHTTLLRTFVFHYSLYDNHKTTMQEVEKKLQTIENSGMTCMITLKDITTDPTHVTDPDPNHPFTINDTDLDFAKQVVSYAGNRCNLYEIGNEPDLDGYTTKGVQLKHLSSAEYVIRWNEFVTELRKINPLAKFIGPATYNDQGNDCYYGNGTPPAPGVVNGDCYMQQFLKGAKASGVLPDAVSFHWYPCEGDTAASCLPKAASYAQVTTEVKSWVHADLGIDVPVGITEWNMDPGSNSTLGNDAQFMAQFTTDALNEMISAHLDFANQFDAQNSSGYGALDMFDITNGDKPKAQFTALKNIISQYYLPSDQTATPTPTLLPSITSTPSAAPTATANPSPTAVPTITRIPSGSLILYANGVASGFKLSSFGVKNQNLCDTTMFVSPSCSLKVTYQRWGGISFYPKKGTLTTSKYTSLDWNIQTGGQPISDFSVVVLNSQGNWINEAVLNTKFATPIGTTGWLHITLPTSVLNPKKTFVKYVQFKNALAKTLMPIHVDDIQFTQ